MPKNSDLAARLVRRAAARGLTVDEMFRADLRAELERWRADLARRAVELGLEPLHSGELRALTPVAVHAALDALQRRILAAEGVGKDVDEEGPPSE